MKHTSVVVAAVAVAGLAGCARAPERLAGEAAPIGAASPAPPPSPAATARPSLSSTPSLSAPPSSRPASPGATSPSATGTSTPTKKPGSARVTRVIGPANVLGPTGLGKLQIGMTTTEAEATGMVEAGEGEGDCGSWYLKPAVNGDATVGWTSRGVSSIPAYDRIATPEGIRIGSTLDQAERAYDDLSGVAADKDGGSWGDGPALAGQQDGHANVHYRFLFVNGAVVKLILEHDQPQC